MFNDQFGSIDSWATEKSNRLHSLISHSLISHSLSRGLSHPQYSDGSYALPIKLLLFQSQLLLDRSRNSFNKSNALVTTLLASLNVDGRQWWTLLVQVKPEFEFMRK